MHNNLNGDPKAPVYDDDSEITTTPESAEGNPYYENGAEFIPNNKDLFKTTIIKDDGDILTSSFFERMTLPINEILKNFQIKYSFNNEYCIKEMSTDDFLQFIKENIKNNIDIFCGNKMIIKLSISTLIFIDLNINNIDDTIKGVFFKIAGSDLQETRLLFKQINEKFKVLTKTKKRFINLNWWYNTTTGYRNISMQDPLSEVFLQEAYPYLNVKELAKSYVEGEEPIMVLIGPPGTGKTRLIRYILNEICNLQNKNVTANMTSDQVIIENGDLFIRGIGTSGQTFLILEDIDFHLSDRKGGNTAMYNFLSISNGLAVGHQKNKKIFLSTNLPNVNNIDEALLRPGRCFGIIETRKLYYDESLTLLKKIGVDKDLNPKKSYTIAELYNLTRTKKYKTDSFKEMFKESKPGFIYKK